MAKAQGLPLSFIVLAAISALVLILVIAFTIGGLGGFFRQITIAGGVQDLSTVQTACKSACDRLLPGITETQFKSSDYCTRTYTVDLNVNNKFDTGESGLHCWTASTTVGTKTYTFPIGIDCNVDTFTKDTCTTGGGGGNPGIA